VGWDGVGGGGGCQRQINVNNVYFKMILLNTVLNALQF
jgi:hypothetical protein